MAKGTLNRARSPMSGKADGKERGALPFFFFRNVETLPNMSCLFYFLPMPLLRVYL